MTNDNIWQLCMNLLWCTEVLYHLFVFCFFFALNFAHICVLVYVAPRLFLGLRQEWTRAAVKVYFRQGNRTGKKKGRRWPPHTHTHPQTRKKGYASMLHTPLGGTHCMNEAVVRVFLCLSSVSNHAYVRTHPSNSSSCSCEPLLTSNLVISFFLWAAWECLPMKYVGCVCVRRACGHQRGVGHQRSPSAWCQEEEQSGRKEEPTRAELRTDREWWRQGYRQRQEGSDTSINRIDEHSGNNEGG